MPGLRFNGCFYWSPPEFAHDRTTKLRIYAAANIPQYIILNLADRQIEDHRQPQPGAARYATTEIIRPHQTVQILLTSAKLIEFPVADLLP